MKFLSRNLRKSAPTEKAGRLPDWQDPPGARREPPLVDQREIDDRDIGNAPGPGVRNFDASGLDMVDLDLGDLQDLELQVADAGVAETPASPPGAPLANTPPPDPRPVGRRPVRPRPADPRRDSPAPVPAEPEPPSEPYANAPERAGEGWLVANNLRRSFAGRAVVQDVSLAVRRGEAVGLLGPNGAGKTTLFYMITGLIRADSGTITLDGRNVTRLPMYRRARLGIGYLPQESSIFRGLNVEDNIRAVLQVVEPNRKKQRLELDALLDEFGISHLRKSPSISLSGGERRRCEIARALASRPSFVLLDEPFAGIDPIAVGDIQALVRHLTARGIGILITDHNVRETLGLVDRAYIIHTGQVLTEGRPDEIIENPDVRRVYLGDSFTL